MLRAVTQGQPESLRDSCPHLHWTRTSFQSACSESRPVLALGKSLRGRNPGPCPQEDKPKKRHQPAGPKHVALGAKQTALPSGTSKPRKQGCSRRRASRGVYPGLGGRVGLGAKRGRRRSRRGTRGSMDMETGAKADAPRGTEVPAPCPVCGFQGRADTQRRKSCRVRGGGGRVERRVIKVTSMVGSRSHVE